MKTYTVGKETTVKDALSCSDLPTIEKVANTLDGLSLSVHSDTVYLRSDLKNEKSEVMETDIDLDDNLESAMRYILMFFGLHENNNLFTDDNVIYWNKK